MPKPKALSTQELKERGWTPAMIRDLLGPHDRERANEMRVGRRDRRVDAPVKLYLEERVLQAESTERFAQAQDAARTRQDSTAQAAETRKARNAAAITAYLDGYKPTITPHPDAATMTRQQLWSHHLDEYYGWQMDHSLPRTLNRQERQAAENALYTKHRTAVHAAYGWEDNS